MKSDVSSKSTQLLLQAEVSDPKLPDAVRDVVAHFSDEEALELRGSAVTIVRDKLAEVLDQEKKSRYRQHVFRSLILFDDVRKALMARVDEKWADADGSPKSYAARMAGCNHFYQLLTSELFAPEELENFERMSRDEDPTGGKDYSVSYKREFLRIFSIARYRILELYQSLDEETVAGLEEWVRPSETRPFQV